MEEFQRVSDEERYASLRTEESTSSFMTKVFMWMTLGLALTGIIAYVVSLNPQIVVSLFTSKIIYAFFLGELALVWYFSSRINQLSLTSAVTLFLVYASVNGITLASIFLIYSMGTISLAFFVTAGTFGAMATYGYVTKRDLTTWGTTLRMGLFGLIIASVVNIFMGNEMIYWITTYVGVILFVGLTAYDTQRIKAMSNVGAAGSDAVAKAAILGALTLYLDFINLFLYLLRILSRLRD